MLINCTSPAINSVTLHCNSELTAIHMNYLYLYCRWEVVINKFIPLRAESSKFMTEVFLLFYLALPGRVGDSIVIDNVTLGKVAGASGEVLTVVRHEGRD